MRETARLFLFAILIATVATFGLGCGGDDGSDGVHIDFTLESFIAVADLNGDGLDDLAFTKVHINKPPPHAGYVSVLLQDPNAPGRFMPSGEYRVGDDPWFVGIADVNVDTLPDLVVANSESDTISILLQDAGSPGTFLKEVSIPTDKGPNSVAMGDLNGDDLPDLAVGGPSTVSLYFQDPDGPFGFLPAKRVSVDPETGSHHVAIGDMDGDGYPDLVVSHSGKLSVDTLSSSGGSVSVFLQDEGFPGLFHSAVTSPAADAEQPIFVTIAEFNQDGLPDLAVVNLGTVSDGNTASVSILLQDPARPGAFLTPAYYPTGFRSETVAVADLDADGLVDLAVSNSGYLVAEYDPFIDSYDVVGSVSVLLHDPANPGTFLPARNYEAEGGHHGVAIGNLNGDSLPDLAIAADGVPVLFQDPASPGHFLAHTLVETGSELPP
jgi:hypothetical protein